MATLAAQIPVRRMAPGRASNADPGVGKRISRLIVRALRMAAGNKSRAAEILAIPAASFTNGVPGCMRDPQFRFSR
jgi:hypothetical protein